MGGICCSTLCRGLAQSGAASAGGEKWTLLGQLMEAQRAHLASAQVTCRTLLAACSSMDAQAGTRRQVPVLAPPQMGSGSSGKAEYGICGTLWYCDAVGRDLFCSAQLQKVWLRSVISVLAGAAL